MPNTRETDVIIPAGSYKLDRDVNNPKPDRRRTRDWRSSPVWKKGTEFVVREQRRDLPDDEFMAKLPEAAAARLRDAQTYTVVESVGQHYASLYRIGPGAEEQYAALAAALVPTAESVEQFMTRIDLESGFVQWLVENKKIRRADLEKWWRSYQYGDDEQAERLADLPPCPAVRDGHHCVYIDGHLRSAVTPNHFNAAVGRWLDADINPNNSDVPFRVISSCPSCNAENTVDLGDDRHLYASKIGKATSVYFICEKCKFDWTVSVVARVTLELFDPAVELSRQAARGERKQQQLTDWSKTENPGKKGT